MKVVEAGLFSTVQDLGRPFYQKFGVVVGGAMDDGSARVANWLVGNAEDAAVLELTMVGGVYQFQNNLWFALAGADHPTHLDEQVVMSGRAYFAEKGQTLRIQSAKRGFRSYLAVTGGFMVPPVLGSRSTYLRAKVGGYEGRTLQAGDELPVLGVAGERPPATRTPWRAAMPCPLPSRHQKIRLIAGSEREEFERGSLTDSYVIGPQSDRMGYRLKGSELSRKHSRELRSHAVSCGTVQVPPDGQPIILMKDCQTTGGYPKIGHVIRADWPLLAQARPGTHLHFEWVTLDEARLLYREQVKFLTELCTAIRLRRREAFH